MALYIYIPTSPQLSSFVGVPQLKNQGEWKKKKIRLETRGKSKKARQKIKG